MYVIGYFVIGALCAIALRRLLLRWRIDARGFWGILLGTTIESMLVTAIFWPVTLLGILLYYLLQLFADRTDANFKRETAARLLAQKENPYTALPLDALLKKVEEQKASEPVQVSRRTTNNKA